MSRAETVQVTKNPVLSLLKTSTPKRRAPPKGSSTVAAQSKKLNRAYLLKNALFLYLSPGNKDMGIKGEREDRRKEKQTTDDGKGKNGHQNHRGQRKQTKP